MQLASDWLNRLNHFSFFVKKNASGRAADVMLLNKLHVGEKTLFDDLLELETTVKKVDKLYYIHHTLVADFGSCQMRLAVRYLYHQLYTTCIKQLTQTKKLAGKYYEAFTARISVEAYRQWTQQLSDTHSSENTTNEYYHSGTAACVNRRMICQCYVYTPSQQASKVAKKWQTEENLSVFTIKSIIYHLT